MKKIKFLHNSNIDKIKWDNCIQNSINRNIYACSWYLDIVCQNWACLVYGDYELLFPVVFKDFFIFKKIYHPFFCQQLGPFSRSEEILYNRDVIYNLINILYANYIKFTFSINHDCVSVFKDVIQNNKLRINYVNRINLELDLDQTYPALFENYSNHHKRTLKHNCSHLKWDVQNETISDIYINEFINLYMKKVGVQAKLSSDSASVIRTILNSSFTKKNGYLIGLRNEKNQLLGAAFFISYFDRDILLFNVSDKSFKFNLMTFIIDYYIKMNVQKKKVLDFEGSNVPGLYRFYKGFGSVEKNYIHIIK